MSRNSRAASIRFLYVPVLAGLLILPVVFTYYAKTALAVHVGRTYSIMINDSNRLKAVNKMAGLPFDYLPDRYFLTVTFTGETAEDYTKLCYARLRIREIIESNDSSNGVHFHFTADAAYWTFTTAIDILYSEYAKFFVLNDDEIWFYHLPSFKSHEDPVKSIKMRKEKFPSGANLLDRTAHSIIVGSWSMVIAFCLLILSTTSRHRAYREIGSKRTKCS